MCSNAPPGFKEIGAGIVLWPNALTALRHIGLSEQVDLLAKPQPSGGIRRPDGRWLSRWDGQLIEQNLGTPAVGIHRAQLPQTIGVTTSLRGTILSDDQITGFTEAVTRELELTIKEPSATL